MTRTLIEADLSEQFDQAFVREFYVTHLICGLVEVHSIVTILELVPSYPLSLTAILSLRCYSRDFSELTSKINLV